MAAGSVRKRHSKGCVSRGGGRCDCRAGWSFRFYGLDGRQRERGGFPTKKAASAALRDELGKVDRGTWREPPKPISLDEFGQRWLETVRPNLKPSTYASYEGALRVHLEPFFGSTTPVRSLRREHVERFLAAKLNAKKHARSCERGSACECPPAWRPKTVRNALVVLKTMLSTAVEWGYLDQSPAEKVRPPRLEHVERESLTLEELGRVLAVAGEPWALMFELAAWSGLRRGELLALQRGDLELGEPGSVHVRRSLGRYGMGTPKSKAGRRVVALEPRLRDALRRHLNRGAVVDLDPDPAEFLFPSPRRAAMPIDPDALTGAWERALRRAGVRHMPLHALRHTAASLMVASGATVKEVQRTLGHASAQLTMDVYAHLWPDSLENLALKMGELRSRDREGTTEGTTGREAVGQ